MNEKQQLIEWIKNVSLENYIHDKQIQVLVSQLRERIQLLSKDNAKIKGKSHLNRIKILAIGDGAVGKTSLLMTYISGKFPPDYIPTVFENHTKMVNSEKYGDVLLNLWDTAGQEDYDRLRPLSYPGADIVLVCFSVINRSSYKSVKEKWYPEISHYIPDVPTILVGTKVDLRESEETNPELKDSSPIFEEEGKKMAAYVNSIDYLEVSSKNYYNLDFLFDKSIEYVLEMRQKLDSKIANQDETDNEATECRQDSNPSKVTRRHKPDRCLLF